MRTIALHWSLCLAAGFAVASSNVAAQDSTSSPMVMRRVPLPAPAILIPVALRQPPRVDSAARAPGDTTPKPPTEAARPIESPRQAETPRVADSARVALDAKPATAPASAPVAAAPQGQAPPSRPAGAAGAQQPVTGPTGRVVGRVVDRETSRPIQGAQVAVVGFRAAAATDLDGRYDIAKVPIGRQTVMVRMIGYRPQRIDSVLVREGQAVSVNAALVVSAAQLQAVAVTAEADRTTNSDVGLLMMQKNAAGVSDGISAQAISRTPASNAADAITKVTGVTVQDNRFVIVRGLGERWNNTSLNGAELPSPEPQKRVVPLDIFPASLLESIVTTKSGTPDKPGDFTGGSVEIRTKEFPDDFTAEIGISTEGNSQTTGVVRRYPQLRGMDYVGVDRYRRLPGGQPTSFNEFNERWAESVRNVWVPPASAGRPALGLSANVGGQIWRDRNPLGIVASLTLSQSANAVPDRLFAAFGLQPQPARQFLTTEATQQTDLGALLNLSWRLGASTKLSLKNTYTRNAEESSFISNGIRLEKASSSLIGYQMRYIARELWQSQLAGEHRLPLSARFEWRTTYSRAQRDEPDNRNTWYEYGQNNLAGLASAIPSNLWARFLNDEMLAVQADVTLPFKLRRREDSNLKFGALARTKARTFDATNYNWLYPSAPNSVVQLPPEGAFAPENLQRGIVELLLAIGNNVPYSTQDTIVSWYAMADVSPFRWLRLVGGARTEDWRLLMLLPGNQQLPEIRRADRDVLLSGNATLKFGDKVNLRFSAFQGVVRPDPRELSPEVYIGVGAECQLAGNPSNVRGRTTNADARFEVYPAPGELFTVGAFAKRFERPFIERVSFASGGDCTQTTNNADSAVAYGVELELRKSLRAIGLKKWSLSTNVTYTESDVFINPVQGTYDKGLSFVGLSPWVVNAGINWGDPGGAVDWSVQHNWFSDRLIMYGPGQASGNLQAPNYFERGRHTLDVKVRWRLGKVQTSLSLRNLLDPPWYTYTRLATGEAAARLWRLGRTAKLGMSYAF
jgi:hypothetical protein